MQVEEELKKLVLEHKLPIDILNTQLKAKNVAKENTTSERGLLFSNRSRITEVLVPQKKIV